MDEYMLMKYLQKQGMNEEEFMRKFREFNDSHKTSFDRSYGSKGSYPHQWERSKEDFFTDFNRGGIRMNKAAYDDFSNDHFISSEAFYLVSQMYHTEEGRRMSGEKYGIDKAKEICDRYKGFLPSSVKAEDVYVAINAQYHDYACLFKSWFGDRIDSKVIESAIVFWFKDEDNPGTHKLIKYFRDK